MVKVEEPEGVTPKLPGMDPTSVPVATIEPPQVRADPTQTPALHESTLHALPSSQRLPSARPLQAVAPDLAFRQSEAVLMLGAQSG